MSNNIRPVDCNCSSSGIKSLIDYEYQEIIRKLALYGLRPSGSKSTDRARLHQIELREAEKESCITTKFLTVSTEEQEKIQAKKQEKKDDINPELEQNKLGQEILGEQIFLAIKLKDKLNL